MFCIPWNHGRRCRSRNRSSPACHNSACIRASLMRCWNGRSNAVCNSCAKWAPAPSSNSSPGPISRLHLACTTGNRPTASCAIPKTRVCELSPVWAWYRPGPGKAVGKKSPTTLNTLPPEAWGDFADFVAAFAARYQDVVEHLIIWNEPNLAFEWGHAAVSPREYVELLRLTHDAVRAASPKTILLAAGPAPTLEPPGSPQGMNDSALAGRKFRRRRRGLDRRDCLA